ncbi:GNAT family N-acetyltransferase [Paenibacillus terrigena]|uniref:GNAT family N-acetyltransferase n=1 Tax=Paenibacillus terrigena TaxID=369333 RepID=UPI0028D3787B|nr:GNAT family N-acetyltransferase [Paenibacillus terrigena]
MKSRYKSWIQEREVPVFCTDWWLDAACGKDNWDVAGYMNDGDGLEVYWPFHFKRKWGMKVIVMPKLTQKLDIQSSVPAWKSAQESISHDVMNHLLDQMPSVHYIDQAMQLSSTYAMSLLDQGFTETVYYTYVIPDLSDLDAVLCKFSKSKRKDVRKGESLFDVRYDMSPNEWYDFHQMALTKQGKQISYTKDFFEQVATAALQRNAGRIMYAVDVLGQIHSALFMVWDKSRAYLLLSSYDPDFKTSRSFPYLLIRAIEEASKYTKMFDFEGSMIQGVEAENRQYGTEQQTYSVLSKCCSIPSHLRANWMRLKQVIWSVPLLLPSFIG